MFELWLNSSRGKNRQAILCVIIVNTWYVFVATVEYVKNVKAMEEQEWKSKITCVLLNNKDSSLVLILFKHTQKNTSCEFPY